MTGWSCLGYVALLILIGLLAMFFVQMDYLNKGIPWYVVIIIAIAIVIVIKKVLDYRNPMK